ncbi:alpha/beta fold hydrolase [Amycolatopsis thermophila]|uniref:Pimeloyl-ACP methyl ester carboxylesterase n=1 Tax=Amycolatopsis thermophila TaxID=206084 RepID=A0ABU0ETZ8_9PSEU|nr:alpha/beta fold hydrolase [Amycolatopsis thermophila]MDQ0378262.1 pimeloyl-ACP methyl ester carboxylesterase [Amycolatopsis thermophila]
MTRMIRYFTARDGCRLAYREVGEGRPLVLIHGYFSTSQVNWVSYGHAEHLAGLGFRVIMLDLRGHGESAKPHDPAAYPPDVLADDGFDLLGHLGLTGYDLGGYSLGGRTTIRMLVRGARPRRAVVAGMGLHAVEHTGGSNAHFREVLTNLGSFERGTREWRAEAFFKQIGGDREALLHILDTSVDTPRVTLQHLETPTLVVAGIDDPHNRTAPDLAEALPHGRYATVPGNHLSAVAQPELGQAIGEFLTS